MGQQGRVLEGIRAGKGEKDFNLQRNSQETHCKETQLEKANIRERACVCGGFVALLWLICHPVMETSDSDSADAAKALGTFLGNGFDWQGLRGAGLGGHVA